MKCTNYVPVTNYPEGLTFTSYLRFLESTDPTQKEQKSIYLTPTTNT